MTAVQGLWGAAPVRGLREFMLKRGVLYALTQMPMTALLVGYFFRWTTYSMATVFTVILAFVLLPAWIAYRRSRSDDPDEPANRIGTLLLYALVPYVVYNVARVPMHYLLNVVFWDHWYDFGSEITGRPVDHWSSLIPGTFLHSLQGYVLALGFFVLFKRYSLFNALLYVWIFLSAFYAYLFPTWILVDFAPPPKWFWLAWWAHFWMAIAAWLTPKLYAGELWRRLGGLARASLVVGVLLIYIYPFSFVFWRVAQWQFPLQRAIDEATFAGVAFRLEDEPTLISAGAGSGSALATGESTAASTVDQNAHYRFTLRFGPRIYQDYIKASKALDAGPVQVTGTLLHGGEFLASCSTYVEMLETPNTIRVPAEYFPALRRMEFTDIPVDCVGPSAAAAELAGASVRVDVQWRVEVMLIGDREKRETTFEALERARPLLLASS